MKVRATALTLIHIPEKSSHCLVIIVWRSKACAGMMTTCRHQACGSKWRESDKEELGTRLETQSKTLDTSCFCALIYRNENLQLWWISRLKYMLVFIKWCYIFTAILLSKCSCPQSEFSTSKRLVKLSDNLCFVKSSFWTVS